MIIDRNTVKGGYVYYFIKTLYSRRAVIVVVAVKTSYGNDYIGLLYYEVGPFSVATLNYY